MPLAVRHDGSREAWTIMTATVMNMASYRAARSERMAEELSRILAAKQRSEARPTMATMVFREEQRWADQRDEHREALSGTHVPSLLLCGTPAAVENISPNGLMATADLDHEIGASVLIDFAGCRGVSGRLVWKRDGMVGVEVPDGALEHCAFG